MSTPWIAKTKIREGLSTIQTRIFQTITEPTSERASERAFDRTSFINLKDAGKTLGITELFPKKQKELKTIIHEIYLKANAALSKGYSILQTNNSWPDLLRASSQVIKLDDIRVDDTLTILSITQQYQRPINAVVVGFGNEGVCYLSLTPHRASLNISNHPIKDGYIVVRYHNRLYMVDPQLSVILRANSRGERDTQPHITSDILVVEDPEFLDLSMSHDPDDTPQEVEPISLPDLFKQPKANQLFGQGNKEDQEDQDQEDQDQEDQEDQDQEDEEYESHLLLTKTTFPGRQYSSVGDNPDSGFDHIKIAVTVSPPVLAEKKLLPRAHVAELTRDYLKYLIRCPTNSICHELGNKLKVWALHPEESDPVGLARPQNPRFWPYPVTNDYLAHQIASQILLGRFMPKD